MSLCVGYIYSLPKSRWTHLRISIYYFKWQEEVKIMSKNLCGSFHILSQMYGNKTLEAKEKY